MKSLSRNALMNVVKQFCTIAFPLITFTYSSRVLGKDGIGIYSYSNSIISYFILLASLGIPTYAAREGARLRDNSKYLQTFASEVFTINVISMIISYLFLLFTIHVFGGFQDYRTVIVVQSTIILLQVLGADWINTIEEDYAYLTIRYIIIQFIALILILCNVKDPSDLMVYTIISVFATAGGNCVNFFYIRRYVRLKLVFSKSIIRHMSSILILFASSIASIIYLNSDITLIGYLRSDAEVGVYTVASKIYQLAKGLINALVVVTIPRFSNYIANGAFDMFQTGLNKIINLLLLLLVPMTLGIYLKSSQIILLVGGVDYLDGTRTLQLLCPALFFAVAACVLAHSILIPNRCEKTYLIATGISASMNIVLNILLLPSFGIIAAAFTTLVAEMIMVIIMYKKCKCLVCIVIDRKNVLQITAATIPVVLICIVVSNYISNNFLDLLLSLSLSFVAYYSLLRVTGNELIAGYRNIVYNTICERFKGK